MRAWLLFIILISNARPSAAQDVSGIGRSASLPGTCTMGASTYLTTGSSGLYVCASPNVWTRLVPDAIVNFGANLPGTCLAGAIFTVTGVSGSFNYCNPANTWNAVGGGGGVPAGMLTVLLSGTCPAGWTESSALNGTMIRGTVAANGDVGQTGGADSITPAGTITAPTFTGNSVASSLVSAGTPAGTNGTGTVTPLGTIAWPAGVPTYTGTVNTLAVTAHTVVATKQGAAAGNVVTTATHAITGIPGGTVAWPAGVPTLSGSSSVTSAEVFTGSALGTHQHTTTATGSNSVPTFTGTAFNNRPAYVNAIFCSKN